MLLTDSEMICWCSGVTAGQIRAARENGAVTLEDIRRTTGACTVGRCKELNPQGRCCSADIKKLLDENICQEKGAV